MSIADNIVLINNGLIEDHGPPDRVYLRPASLFAARFMGDSNIFPGEVVRNDAGRVEVVTRMGNLNIPGDAETGAKVHLVLRPEQIKVGAGEGDDNLPLGRTRVIDVTFQGTHRLCHALGGADGTVELLLRLPPEHAVSPSDFLNIYARASDAVLLRH